MKTFFQKNKVFLLGLASALAVVLQEAMSAASVNWSVVGFAALMAGLSYVAKSWRGAGITITGIIGTLADVFVTNYNGGKVDVPHLIVLALLAIFAAVAPPAKPASYEAPKEA